MIYDFIVVGGGIAGASIAYELAATGSVCLVEGENQPGVHTTGRSAALFIPTYGGSEVRAITRASRGFFDTPPEGFTESPLLEERGCLYPARKDQKPRLEEMVSSIRASGGDIVKIDAVEALQRVPLLRASYVAEAAYDAASMDIDVNSLHQGYLRGARARGTDIVTANWVRHAERRAGLWHVALAERMISAPVLVNAAGAWADEVARSCDVEPVGLQALHRTAILVDPPADVDIRHWPAVIDCDERFYFKPDAGKLLLSPADETPVEPGDAQPDELDIAIAVDRVQAALDIEVRRVSHSWAGLRTFARDRVPVVGFDAKAPGFFWCAGQGGYGIQTAPALARTAAALARSESLPADVAAEGLRMEEISPWRLNGAPVG